MNSANYLSPLFGSPEWYYAIRDTYRLKNPHESQDYGGLQIPLKGVYSLLPFSDWYYEVEDKEELAVLTEELIGNFKNVKFQARVLVKNDHSSSVSTYRMDRLDPDARLKAMSKTTRRYTRNSLKNGFSLEVSDSSAIDRFFRLHALTRKKLGLPVQPKRFFINIMEKLPGSRIAFCITKERKDAAAFFLLKAENILYYKYGASNPKLLRERPNHYLFYMLHDIAEKENLDTIDLGRTDEPGLHQFKAGLGSIPIGISIIGPTGLLPYHEERKRVLMMRKFLSLLPVGFHITAGKLFYKYLA